MKRIVALLIVCISSIYSYTQDCSLDSQLQDTKRRGAARHVVQQHMEMDYLNRIGNTYFYGDMKMQDDQYVQFLYKNSKAAYDEYVKGRQLTTAGWYLFGVGWSVQALVLPWVAFENELSAWIVGATSFAAIITSIPLLSVGTVRKHRSVEVFNVNYGYEPSAYLTLTTSQNGVGLVLNF